MNILAVGAHPDDVETMCAGTLAKYAAQGHKVFIATATNGNIGSAHHTMEEIGRIRKQEAANSAAIIGAEYICLEYDDEMFFEIDRETRLKFINLVRHCKADVIFTHNPHDYNPDHMLTSKIINDIAVMIPIAHLKTEEPPYNVIPSIWYFEPANSMGFVPTDYVDITDYLHEDEDALLHGEPEAVDGRQLCAARRRYRALLRHHPHHVRVPRHAGWLQIRRRLRPRPRRLPHAPD